MNSMKPTRKVTRDWLPDCQYCFHKPTFETYEAPKSFRVICDHCGLATLFCHDEQRAFRDWSAEENLEQAE